MRIVAYRSIFIIVFTHLNAWSAAPLNNIGEADEGKMLVEVRKLAAAARSELLKIPHQKEREQADQSIEKADQFREQAWEKLMPVIKAQKTTKNKRVIKSLKYLVCTGVGIANARDDVSRKFAVETMVEEISNF